jgi:hypothetical protein
MDKETSPRTAEFVELHPHRLAAFRTHELDQDIDRLGSTPRGEPGRGALAPAIGRLRTPLAAFLCFRERV